MDKKKKEEDGWLRLESKSRPGRFYIYNKATRETKWLPLKPDTELKKEPQPKISVKITGKTPAQDRLKRLQRNLKIGQIKQTNATTTHPAALKTKTSKEQENKLGEQPSSSSSYPYPSYPLKISANTASLPNGSANSNKYVNSSILDNSKNALSTESLKKVPSDKIGMLDTTATRSFSHSGTNENFENVQKKEDHISKLDNFRSGIVKKIKEICKIPFNASKKSSNTKDVKSPALLNTTKFKPAKKPKSNNCLKMLSAENKLINDIKDEKQKSLELSTPEKQGIPSYPRGSANTRLDRLKQSLISQQNEQPKPCIKHNNLSTENHISKLAKESNNDKNAILLPIANGPNVSSASGDIIDNEIEAMDWQPILRNDDPPQKTGSESTLVVEKSKKLVLNRTSSQESQTMSDIIDTVNENLLRFSAEKRNEYNNNNYKKWHKDFYYFVVDTNVLLRDLTFVEDLSNMKLCDTKGSMLYIPYSVLQELDKLKMRCGAQESVKTLAVRAIKYLNAKFESNSPHLQAQSALDERRCLVDINSADDSIINCCLQAKKHIPNLILLTEDINLRNKAICNNIMVSTKSDLLSKRYDSRDRP